MSASSEEETDAELFDNDDDDDDDQLDGLAERYADFDDECDFEDLGHFSLLYERILGTAPSDIPQADPAHIPADYILQQALSNPLAPSTSRASSSLLVDDSLHMYLHAPPLLRKARRANRHCLALDPTIDDRGMKTLATPELHIGNLPYGTKWAELKGYLEQTGYRVSRVDVKVNKVRKSSALDSSRTDCALFQRGAAYAFARFDSIATAMEVLRHGQQNKLIFNCNILVINHRQKSLDIVMPLQSIRILDDGALDFPIAEIHYGILVTKATMKTIHRANSIVSNPDECGIVAHRLFNYAHNTKFTFCLDEKRKRIAIAAEYQLPTDDLLDVVVRLRFEWSFHE